MGKITKNYMYNLVYQLFVMLVPLLTAPYLARTLGAEGTGIFGYVHSSASLVCTIVMLGIYNYGNRLIAYSRDNEKKISESFARVMGTRVIIAVFGTIVYIIVSLYNYEYTLYFFVYYTYILAYFIDCTWFYVGIEEMKWAVLKNSITKIIALLGIFILVRSSDDIWKYVLIQGLSVLLSNFWAYFQLKKYIKHIYLDFTYFFEDIKGSFLLFLPSFASVVYLQCDKIMIEWFTDTTIQVSYYDYAEKIVMIPLTFITVLSTVMMPRIANEYKNENKEVISNLLFKASNFSLFIACPMMFGLIAVADKLIPWYLGNNFIACISAIVLISPIVITNAMTGISGGLYFTATNQLKTLTIIQILAAITNIFINAILIPKLGYIGAAIATSGTSVLCAIMQYYILLRQINLDGILKSGVKYFSLASVMFIIIHFLTYNMEPTPITNLIQVGIGITFYSGINLLLKDKTIFYLINKSKSLLKKYHYRI